MPLRKFLTALVLGLPAAVAAHFLTFGGAHTVGGEGHFLLINGMVVALCASMLALCGSAVYVAAGNREGSILAAALERLMPSTLMLALAGGGWFALIERAEESHATPIAVAALAVLCVALLLRLGLSSALRALANVALRFFTSRFESLEHERFDHFIALAPACKRFQLALSHYSRPPPRFP